MEKCDGSLSDRVVRRRKGFLFPTRFSACPDQVKRKRITLHFELIMENFTVWINGRKFQGRPDSGTHSVLDISSAVQAGRNEILVRVFNDFQNRRWADSMPLVSWAVTNLMESMLRCIWKSQIPSMWIR